MGKKGKNQWERDVSLLDSRLMEKEGISEIFLCPDWEKSRNLERHAKMDLFCVGGIPHQSEDMGKGTTVRFMKIIHTLNLNNS